MLIIFFTLISPSCFWFFARREGVVFVCKHEQAPWGLCSFILAPSPALCHPFVIVFLHKYPPPLLSLLQKMESFYLKKHPRWLCTTGGLHLLLLFLYLYYLYALVIAAGRAYAVGQLKGAALGAAAHSGSFQLPHIAASFVLSCFRAFSLRYCHLVFPPTLISLCFCQNISFPAACAVHPSGGRRCPHGSRTGPRSGSCRRSGTAPCSPPGTGSAGAAPAGCRW